MNILVIGNDAHLAECKQKFGDQHTYTVESQQEEAEKHFKSSDAIFDFVIDKDPAQMQIYSDYPSQVVFINTSKISLLELASVIDHKIQFSLFGFVGLPTFLNRHILEVSLYRKEQQSKLEAVCQQLNTPFLIVDDRVGLVTPRVICMIINEAYYTVQEGTATREDIDLAMKLGTNYPFGPFEWAHRIGINHVYELLDAVYEDTRDERYKICPLLKKEYLLHSY